MAEPTLLLLRRWQNGDPQAFGDLLERHLPTIRAHVERRLGPRLRQSAESGDFVQDVVVEFLRVGPRFRISDDVHFRRLLARIVENVLCAQHDWYSARRRSLARERPIPNDTILDLDPPRRAGETPSAAASQHEDEAWVRLGLELLDPARRDLVVLRQWDGLSFPAIGEKLGITENAARLRHMRAMSDLSTTVAALRRGDIESALSVAGVEESA
jgi:RNA polymerase sigma-70 factor (ECF subfamily)